MLAFPQRLIAVLLLGLVAGAAPAAANTTTVSHGPNGFTVRVTDETAGHLVNNVIVDQDSGGNLLVSSFASVLVAGPGCSLQTSTRVSCPPDPEGNADLEVTTGHGADAIDVRLPAGRPATGIFSIHVYGGPGSDLITGGPATETLDGDGRHGNGLAIASVHAEELEGSDVIWGGGGPDTLLGHGRQDYLNGSGATAADAVDSSPNTLDGGKGADFFDTGGMLGADRITGGSGDDEPDSRQELLNGRVLQNGEKAQTSGGDTVSYGTRTFTVAGTAGVTADLDGVADDGLVGEGDQIDADVEALVGSIRDDRLTGSDGPNRLEGRLGFDTLVAGAGADQLRFKDGVKDKCFVAGAGDDVELDLTDPPAELCRPKTLRLPFETTLNAQPADETIPYVVLGQQVRKRGRSVIATVACQRAARRACTGTLAVSRDLGRPALARRRFRAKPGRAAMVALQLSLGEVAALKRAGRVLVTSVSKGTSKLGLTTTIVMAKF